MPPRDDIRNGDAPNFSLLRTVFLVFALAALLLFKPLIDSLLYGGPYLPFADYRSYVESQEQVSLAYKDQAKRTRMSILNVARMGKFSSDRSIKEYCKEIWKVGPLPIKLGKYTIG